MSCPTHNHHHRPRTDNNNDAAANQSVRMRRHTPHEPVANRCPIHRPTADSVTRANQHCAQPLSNNVLVHGSVIRTAATERLHILFTY
ncbi:hypothetical protein COCC4DRAFT_87524, partial [Bipolaris maydis ATCC 48331]